MFRCLMLASTTKLLPREICVRDKYVAPVHGEIYVTSYFKDPKQETPGLTRIYLFFVATGADTSQTTMKHQKLLMTRSKL